jgi:hypothetical protein
MEKPLTGQDFMLLPLGGGGGRLHPPPPHPPNFVLILSLHFSFPLGLLKIYLSKFWLKVHALDHDRMTNTTTSYSYFSKTISSYF